VVDVGYAALANQFEYAAMAPFKNGTIVTCATSLLCVMLDNVIEDVDLRLLAGRGLLQEVKECQWQITDRGRAVVFIWEALYDTDWRLDKPEVEKP